MAGSDRADAMTHRAMPREGQQPPFGGGGIGRESGVVAGDRDSGFRTRQSALAAQREGQHAPRLRAVVDADRQQRSERRAAGAHAGQHGHVLAPADGIGDRRSGDRRLRGKRPQQFAGITGIGVEPAVDPTLEHQIAARGHDPAVPRPRSRHFPDLLLGDGIPRDQRTRGVNGTCVLHLEIGIGRTVHRLARRTHPVFARDAPVVVARRHFDCRDIDQLAHWAVGHRQPGMRPHRAGPHGEGLAIGIARIGNLNRSARGNVNPGRPSDFHEGLGRDQLSVDTVDDIEKAVLGCGHQHVPQTSLDRQVGQRHVHRGVVVPAFAGIGLVMPLIAARLRIQPHNRGQKQVIPLPHAADLVVPRRAIAHAQDHGVGGGIVGHGVPDCAATAHLPPFARPGLGCQGLRLVLEPVRRIAGHCVKAPELLASRCIVGSHIAANIVDVRAAKADDDLPVEHARSAADEAGVSRRCRLHVPRNLAGARIKRQQPPIVRAHEQSAMFIGKPADTPTLPQLAPGHFGHLRVIHPQFLAGGRLDRADHAIAGGDIEHAIDSKRRRNRIAQRQVIRPDKPQLLDGMVRNLGQRAEMLLTSGPPESSPVRRIIGRSDGLVRRCRRLRDRCQRQGRTRQKQQRAADDASCRVCANKVGGTDLLHGRGLTLDNLVG